MRTENSLVGSAPAKPDKTAVREVTRRENDESHWKRSNHGGVAWAATDAENLHQPQDGAQETGTLYTALTRKAMFREPEDARLTGGTRSLMRRVMGLNVTALARKAAPKAIAGKPQTQVA
jgi:hypothetical protein